MADETEWKGTFSDWMQAMLGLAMIVALLWFAPGWCSRIAKDAEADNLIYRVASSAFGCLDADDVGQLALLSSDRVAYYIQLRRLGEAQRCAFLNEGDELVVQRYNAFRELYLARRKRDPTFLWIPKQFVTREKAPAPKERG
jgi:hypothetical protein